MRGPRLRIFSMSFHNFLGISKQKVYRSDVFTAIDVDCTLINKINTPFILICFTNINNSVGLN